MHCVSCMLSLSCFLHKEEREWRTAQRKTSLSVLSNPILALRQHEHEQALSFLGCEEGDKGALGHRESDTASEYLN